VHDAADRAALEAVLGALPPGYPLRGVVHAAGVLDDGLLTNQSAERFYEVLAPKVAGAWNLHSLTRDLALDFFVLYSSAAALLGSPGQGSYAAANAFLDALAHHRRAAGLPALSISWGAFREVGLAAAEEHRLLGRGLRPMSPEEGLRLFERLVASPLVHAAPCPIDLKQWVESFPQYSGWPYLERLEAGAARATDAADLSWLNELRTAPRERTRAKLTAHVLEQLGQVLKADPAALDARAPFKALGVDSLMGLELRNRIASTCGVRLPSTAAWTYPDAASLGEHLLEALFGAPAAPPAEVARAPLRPPEPDAALETLSDEALLEEALRRLGD